MSLAFGFESCYQKESVVRAVWFEEMHLSGRDYIFLFLFFSYRVNALVIIPTRFQLPLCNSATGYYSEQGSELEPKKNLSKSHMTSTLGTSG